MVEKTNDIIKIKTIKITKYDFLEQMNDDLMQFLAHYNLYQRRELKVKTPLNAVEKWYELEKKYLNKNQENLKIKFYL